jgi:lactam utilization protein B
VRCGLGLLLAIWAGGEAVMAPRASLQFCVFLVCGGGGAKVSYPDMVGFGRSRFWRWWLVGA